MASTTPHTITLRPLPHRLVSRALKQAWWSLALLPVAFVAATLLGNELLMLQGIDSDAELDVPIGQAFLAGVPATLVLILPALSAFILSRRVMRAGDMRGQVPAVAGGCSHCSR